MTQDLQSYRVNGYDIFGTEKAILWRVYDYDHPVGGDFETLEEAEAHALSLKPRETPSHLPF